MLEEAVRRQRRRKRRRPQEGTAKKNNHSNKTNDSSTRSNIRSSFEDDSSLAFLDSSGATLSDHKPIQVDLLKLLQQRQVGTFQRSVRIWQQQALFQFTKNPTTTTTTTVQRENNNASPQQRREWRQFAKRSIPFTKLGTPVVDAVLALERKGSFVLSLGAQHPGSDVPLLLALRFYGVPSPSGMERQKQIAGKAMGITPLLQTVPLLYNDIPSNETMEDSIFNFRRNISPASTPVFVLVSNEWKIGMAMFQPSDVWRVGFFSCVCFVNIEVSISIISCMLSIGGGTCWKSRIVFLAAGSFRHSLCPSLSMQKCSHGWDGIFYIAEFTVAGSQTSLRRPKPSHRVGPFWFHSSTSGVFVVEWWRRWLSSDMGNGGVGYTRKRMPCTEWGLGAKEWFHAGIQYPLPPRYMGRSLLRQGIWITDFAGSNHRGNSESNQWGIGTMRSLFAHGRAAWRNFESTQEKSFRKSPRILLQPRIDCL